MTTPKELRKIFFSYYYPINGWTKEVLIEDLVAINKDFKTTNGCQWARNNVRWPDGNKYNIIRKKKNNKIYSIQLCGILEKEENHSIPTEVRKKMQKKKCCILDIKSSNGMEIDHKNGKYIKDKYEENDFQVLSKAANDAKRQHCKECKKSKKRYDAKRLGYCTSFVKGNEYSDYCEGCYWFDPFYFNRGVSKYYK